MINFRMMSFNIRGSFVDDGANVWPARRDLNVRVIRQAEPDLIGFQEMQLGNWEDYQKLLPDYGRELGPQYNNREPYCYPSIFWNTAMFEVIDRGQFWLSRTPEQYSGDWGANCIRSACWLRLRHKASGLSLVMLNTHLDHINKRSRLQGSRLITRQLAQIARPDEPVLVTADFNCDPNSPTYRHFARVGFVDTFIDAGNVDRPSVFTFHAFTGQRDATYGRIDWVLVRATAGHPIQATNARILTDAEPPIFPSDHFPITVDLTIESL